MFRLCYAILRLCITTQDQKVELKQVTKNGDFSFCPICFVHTLHSNNGTNTLKKNITIKNGLSYNAAFICSGRVTFSVVHPLLTQLHTHPFFYAL